MPYMAQNPHLHNGRVIGTGHCVAFVQEASRAPHTSTWKRGNRVRNERELAAGTAIATFDAAGSYTNSRNGTSHAAIYVSQDSKGIQVWDQWLGQPVHQRLIRFQASAPGVKPVNDGDAFHVIE